MRISFDNKFLFTAGRDGNLIIFEIIDKDTRGPIVKREPGFTGITTFSEEILAEKGEMGEFENQKDTLENENLAANDSHSGVDPKMGPGQ